MVGVQIVVKRWQEKAAAHPSFLSDAQAGTDSKNNNDNFMRKSRQYFFSRFLDTGFPLFNIYSRLTLTQQFKIYAVMASSFSGNWTPFT